ncbi:MAG: hypothetical protein RLZZ232_2386 [Planctomycetota bacterium]
MKQAAGRTYRSLVGWLAVSSLSIEMDVESQPILRIVVAGFCDRRRKSLYAWQPASFGRVPGHFRRLVRGC